MLERLGKQHERQRILTDPHTRSSRWDKIVIAHAPECPEWEGLSVAEIADQRAAKPKETALDMLLEAKGRISVVDFGMSEDNLKLALCHPAVMVGSDGSARAPYGPLGEGKAHPRNYGTFPRVLGKYVRQEGILSLPQAVHKMSGLPAERMGLLDRGRLAVSMKADLVLFDPDTVCDTATFTEPYQYPVGIAYVFVNGKAVITPQGHTGALPGLVLERC